MLVDFIDDTVSSIFSHRNELIAPLALTIFVWVFLMNLMDLVPVDWIPQLAHALGVDYMKVVPTTDPNVTMGMALTVFALILYYSIREKGPVGFFKELAFHPFPKILAPVNFILEGGHAAGEAPVAGFAVVRQSLCREMIFILIALMYSGWMIGVFGGVLQWAWAVFHVLIITLQAFIFAVLTVVYLAQAYEVEEEH